MSWPQPAPQTGSFLISAFASPPSRPFPPPLWIPLRGGVVTQGGVPGSVDPSDQKKTACYDIDVEVEEPLKGQMSSFLLSTANQQEISALDSKIHETIESINQLKIQRDFMLSFSRDPKGYVQDLLRSQSRDLKVTREPRGYRTLTPLLHALPLKIQQRRQELEQSLVVRNT